MELGNVYKKVKNKEITVKIIVHQDVMNKMRMSFYRYELNSSG